MTAASPRSSSDAEPTRSAGLSTPPSRRPEPPASTTASYDAVSATDRGHRPVRLQEGRVVDAVARLLGSYGETHQPRELVVGRAVPQRRTQIGLRAREQAGAELP